MIPKELSKEDLKYLDRGKRAKIYTFVKEKKKYALKVEAEESKAKERIKNEIKFLKIVNEKGVGPKLVSEGENYFVYEFAEGALILDFLKKTKNPFPIIREILKQCRILDELKINKLEMHHPMKHIFIKGKVVKMIDFERCYYTEKPKNVTQFCQFLLRAKKLNLDKKRFIPLIKVYKNSQTKQDFEQILKFFS